jgi:hypothetical protein
MKPFTLTDQPRLTISERFHATVPAIARRAVAASAARIYMPVPLQDGTTEGTECSRGQAEAQVEAESD